MHLLSMIVDIQKFIIESTNQAEKMLVLVGKYLVGYLENLKYLPIQKDIPVLYSIDVKPTNII